VSLRAELADAEIVIAPGGEAVRFLRVRNIGDDTASASLLPAGPAQGWTIIDPPTVTLHPGAEETVRLLLRPPRSPLVAAGPSPFTVRVVSHENPDETVVVDSIVTVLGYDDRRIYLAQPVQKARRGAVYDVVVENAGNIRATCRLGFAEITGRLSATIDPPSVSVDPGMRAVVRARVRARRWQWRRADRTVPFRIVAAQDQHAMVETEGALLQTRVVPERTGRLVAGLAGLAGAAAVAWLAVVQPAIDRAVERAVADRVAEAPAVTMAPGTPGGEDPTAVNGGTTAPTSVVAPAEPVRTPFDLRLKTTAAVASTEVTTYTMPEGGRVQIKDIYIQNPNGDIGRVALLRNGDVLFETALENFRDQTFPYVSGYVFAPGDNLGLQLTCSGAGSGASGQCEVAASFVGEVR
jgi:hypothetical protein